MSQVFPPIISSTPPPIDSQGDEEDDFGDFRVANFSLNSPDLSPRSLSPCDRIPGNGLAESKFEVNDQNASPNYDPPPIFCNEVAEKQAVFNSYAPPTTFQNHLKPEPPDIPDYDDTVDIQNELADISLFNCDAPFSSAHNELRTSPEGADSDSVGANEPNIFQQCSESPTNCDDVNSFPVPYDTLEIDGLAASKLGSLNQFDSSEKESIPEEFATFQSESDNQNDALESERPDGVVTLELGCETPNNESNELAAEIGDEFSDFAHFPQQLTADVCVNVGDNASDVDQCNCELKSTVADSCTVQNEQEDEDFDDFEFAEPPCLPSPQEDIPFDKRLDEIFPGRLDDADEEIATTVTGCLHGCLDDSSSVWGHLKDLETSQALSLQWSNSSASKKLLSSLNIDSRNILIGSRLNSSIPRFAATMSCAPLEPLKADAVAPTPIVPSAVVSHAIEDVVPVAQFDWNGSGLINPLDCVEKEAARNGKAEVNSSSIFEAISSPSSSEQPSTDLWMSDILLPSPAGPGPIPEEKNIPVAVSLEDWIVEAGTLKGDSASLEQTVVEPESATTWTISNQLEKTEEVTKSRLSAEACRVVETLPDLSFLSARKLLFAANENLSRFHTTNH